MCVGGGRGGLHKASVCVGGGGGGAWCSVNHPGHQLRPRETQRGRLWTPVDGGVCGQQTQSNDPHNNQHNPQYANYWVPRARTSRHIQHSPNTPTTGLRKRGNDTSRSTGRSGRQNAATRRNMRREERVAVQGPVKEQQPNGMSHGGGGGARMHFTV